MRPTRALVALLFAAAGVPATAGPPYITDDPVPTDLAHWEIYAFTAGDGHARAFDDATGVDLNYGAFKDIQLTATVPLALTRDGSRQLRAGTGDLELAVKYRFLNDERSGISAAVFPRAILPTSTLEHGGKTRLLLPLLVEKDFAGGTSLFGGGGYEINPGPGNRNFWQAGAALTHNVSDRLSLGAEITRQGSDSVGASGETAAGLGAILKLSQSHALLLSGGPTWADHRTGYHVYASLGLDF